MKRFSLKTIIASVFVPIVFIAFGFDYNYNNDQWQIPKEADKLVNPLINVTDATQKGKKLYESMCWTCHGKTGKGDGPAGKSLNPKPANHTGEVVQKQPDGVIFWKITTGKGVMPSYAKVLSDTQRWQLVNYIRTLGKTI